MPASDDKLRLTTPAGAETHVTAEVLARLAAIHAELGSICARFAPTVLSLEQTFVGDNVQSAFRLGEAVASSVLGYLAEHPEMTMGEIARTLRKLAVAYEEAGI